MSCDDKSCSPTSRVSYRRLRSRSLLKNVTESQTLNVYLAYHFLNRESKSHFFLWVLLHSKLTSLLNVCNAHLKNIPLFRDFVLPHEILSVNTNHFLSDSFPVQPFCFLIQNKQCADILSKTRALRVSMH